MYLLPKGQALLLASGLVLAGVLPAYGAVTAPLPNHMVTGFSPAALLAHKVQRQALPRKAVDPVAVQRILQSMAQPSTGTSTAVNLLPSLSYAPSQWDQVNYGNCWVWGSTAACAITYGLHVGAPVGFSVQYLDTNYRNGNQTAGCGGDPAAFAGFYQAQKKFIPWSNPGAAYTDMYNSCGYTPATEPSAISTTLNVPFSVIADKVIPTTGITQAAAIANIKAVLNGGQAVTFAYLLPSAGWADFNKFWDSSAEGTAWSSIDKYSGSTYDPTSGGGGHLVCLVGYDDSDHTWILLNSWGTTNGRADGTFKIPQAMGYNDYLNSGNNEYDQFEFDVYDITWTSTSNVVMAAITSPAYTITVNSGTPVSFTGIGKDSANSPVFNYAWAFGDGGTATGASATHTYTNTGNGQITEWITLTVNDGSGAKGTSTASVFVAPAKNTVTAKITSQTSAVTVPSGTLVSFVGTGTDSSTTATLSYGWVFGDGTLGVGLSAPHSFTNKTMANVTYPVTFSVTDSTGATASATCTVTVLPVSPTAFISLPASNMTVPSYTSVSFVGGGTYPLNPNGLSYSWTFGDGTPGWVPGTSASHQFVNSGIANVTDTVTFTAAIGTNLYATATVLVTVQPVKNLVTATITSYPAVYVVSGTAVGFSGTGTDSSKQALLSYAWSFGDGGNASGTAASHAFTNNGTAQIPYTVTFTVTDNMGVAAKAICTVFVAPAKNTLTAAITSPGASVTVASGTSVSFVGTATDSSKTASLLFQWLLGDGTGLGGTSASHVYYNQGSSNYTYTVNLLVTDSTGVTSKATCAVTVTPATVKNVVTAAITSPAANMTVTSGTAVSFVGTSTDNGKTVTLSNYWDFGDGGLGSGNSTSHVFTKIGTFTVTFHVYDSTNVAAAATRVVTVNPPNVVTATILSPAQYSTVYSGVPVSLSGVGTDSSPTATLSYFWDFGDGLTAIGPKVSHTFTNNFTTSVLCWVSLTVTDNTGIVANKYYDAVMVAPAPAKSTLTARIISPSTTQFISAGSYMQFVGSGIDSDKTAYLTYAWTFGDGVTGTGASISRLFKTKGNYGVTLRVSDGTNTATASCAVVVQ